MKNLFKLALLIISFGLISKKSFSQVISPQDEESYCKANIAFTDFQLLGVTSTQHAKCLRAVNYLEPGKTGKRVTINGTDFVDDGLNYDLVANDGILTSTVLSKYSSDVMPLPVGVYQDIKNKTTVFDNNFAHASKLNESGAGKGVEMDKFKFVCKFVWVSCNSWPENIRSLCFSTSWPFMGYFAVTECEVGWA
ncbi:MAG TPA: hypothetical protein VK483_08200 [Chitinophagaceae bacterium]|nr:hypothetical protein [Chitinophagaceae bacterium]